MTRIVYMSFPTGEIAGGQKMIFRHVEALRDLGFDATVWMLPNAPRPAWFDHRAPVDVTTELKTSDVLVLPEDGQNAIGAAAAWANRCVIFCQNPFVFSTRSLDATDRFPPGRFPAFLAVGPTTRDYVRRLYPQADVEVVPCFADERVFRPGQRRTDGIACSPRKRPMELAIIQQMLRRGHPRHAGLEWRLLKGSPEQEVAATFARSTLCLSLSRLEAIGMTPLEAMASGAVCAGFLGVGGQDFATPDNGFWAPEDDCLAAADALARAADVVAAGGADLAAVREAGFETASRWSYSAFRVALEEAWMRLAPQGRLTNGPLD